MKKRKKSSTSKIIKPLKIYLLLLILILMTARCHNNSSKNNSYNFSEFGLYFDTWEDNNPYNFSSYIKDTIAITKGKQRAAWQFAYIGDIENVLTMWDDRLSNNEVPTFKSIDKFDTFKRKNALKYILEQAINHQVIIINEAHHMPQHRVFTTQLLDGLKELGYVHLGIESYFPTSHTDSTIQALNYPNFYSGSIIKEPQFGNMVRVAKQKGFNIFGYEGNGSGKEREIDQAQNIKAYLDNYPDEKMIIHCGFNHVFEGYIGGSWKKAMAGRLTEYTGINPLTINQTDFSERSKPEYENPAYRNLNLSESSIFLNKNGNVFSQELNTGWVDISVFHPRTITFDRPSWMIYDDRKEFEFEFKNANIECPCLVLAYKEGEKIGLAIPYDIQETKNKKVKLVLDKSNYTFVIWNQQNKAVQTFFTQS